MRRLRTRCKRDSRWTCVYGGGSRYCSTHNWVSSSQRHPRRVYRMVFRTFNPTHGAAERTYRTMTKRCMNFVWYNFCRSNTSPRSNYAFEFLSRKWQGCKKIKKSDSVFQLFGGHRQWKINLKSPVWDTMFFIYPCTIKIKYFPTTNTGHCTQTETSVKIQSVTPIITKNSITIW